MQRAPKTSFQQGGSLNPEIRMDPNSSKNVEEGSVLEGNRVTGSAERREGAGQALLAKKWMFSICSTPKRAIFYSQRGKKLTPSIPTCNLPVEFCWDVLQSLKPGFKNLLLPCRVLQMKSEPPHKALQVQLLLLPLPRYR